MDNSAQHVSSELENGNEKQQECEHLSNAYLQSGVQWVDMTYGNIVEYRYLELICTNQLHEHTAEMRYIH